MLQTALTWTLLMFITVVCYLLRILIQTCGENIICYSKLKFSHLYITVNGFLICFIYKSEVLPMIQMFGGYENRRKTVLLSN